MQMFKSSEVKLRRNAGFRNTAAAATEAKSAEPTSAVATRDMPSPFPRKPVKRKPRPYEPHGTVVVKLTSFQEFLVYMIYLRRLPDKKILSQWWFGDASESTMKQMTSLIRTWVCALSKILKAVNWRLRKENHAKLRSKAFSDPEAKNVVEIGDCTSGVFCQGSSMSELLGQQLYSKYYRGHCGKVAVGCSIIGGTTSCGDLQGGKNYNIDTTHTRA